MSPKGLILLSGMVCWLLTAHAAPASAGMPLPALLRAAQTALDACRERGFKVTVTIIGDDFAPRVVLRDADASDHGVEVSRRKAYTAIKTGLSSKDFGMTLAPNQRIMPPPGYNGPFPPPGPIKDDPSLDPSPGGLPIVVAGARIGAIGVSGASNGDRDEDCARRGLETLTSRSHFMLDVGALRGSA